MYDEPAQENLHAEISAATDALPPPPWAPAGEGLWARVYDLGDGTVLKIVRRHGGLGSGDAKLAREVKALELLGGLTSAAIRVPRLIAHGFFENSYFGAGPALAGWMRSERLPGLPLDDSGLWGLQPAERDRRGEDLGAAIAEFHQLATARAGVPTMLGDSLARSIDEALARISAPRQRAGLKRLKEMWLAGKGTPVFLHGDINFRNVLHQRSGPASLVDFAETGSGVLEADFRTLDTPGPLRDAIYRGYAAVSGAKPDPDRCRMAVAANAAVYLALHGESGHPREAFRRRAWLDEALRQAGVEE
ncbi:MAG TPA: aminoglycoside phosphotransferase family protein [Parvibaculum sp.]